MRYVFVWAVQRRLSLSLSLSLSHTHTLTLSLSLSLQSGTKKVPEPETPSPSRMEVVRAPEKPVVEIRRVKVDNYPVRRGPCVI